MSDGQREWGSGSGAETVYAVEVRSTFNQPEAVGGLLLDARWRRLPTEAAGSCGVRSQIWNAEARDHQFLSYNAARTLAYWFLTNAERGYCLEARIVKVKFTYSYAAAEVGVSEPISLFHAERDAAFSEREPQSLASGSVAKDGAGELPES